MTIQNIQNNAPQLTSVMVTRHLPEPLLGLETLSKNLWWCWNDDAKALFKTVDPELWHNSGHNPMEILDKVSLKRYEVLAKDGEFLSRLSAVMDNFNSYMALKSERKGPQVAYFCMEYGLDSSLKIYSGGLGILAGDYLKETSDMNVNLVAVGFLYRYGYFTQKVTPQGNQVAQYDAQDFSRVPAEPVFDEDGNWKTVTLSRPGKSLTARIWKVAVGRTDLYLLDTDFDANTPDQRQITHQLYGGDWNNRLKQELLLGIGGVRALRTLGIYPRIFHYNEGHAAFAGLERLREYLGEGSMDFDEALELVRASSLFTTHTPVPAGHDSFEESMIGEYLGHYPQTYGISWDHLMQLGKNNPYDSNEKFSMSVLAANMSQNVNGVSMLHGEVSKDIFAPMYPGFLPEELYISYVTNGVHYPTWASKEWKALHATVFGEEFKTHHYDKSCFDGIYQVPDEEIWKVRKIVKSELFRVIRQKISDTSVSGHYSPREIVAICENLREDVLTIGFARRFATYKRATLLFNDLDRLDAIVNNPEHPVQFIFAGKAHPADGGGQDLIRKIINISKQERFLGKVVFVPGYDISLAKRLVQGVDVWMNNPTRPLEASGTSGEKAAMNGVMHFSVLDGWWVEGYKPGCGWALPQESTYDDPNYQNELDAATIYGIIENEISPTFYDIDPDTGLSSKWISCIKNTISKVASNFTTNRMLSDYCEKYYFPQSRRFEEISADSCAKVKEIVAWKRNIISRWNSIKAVSYSAPDFSYTTSSEKPLEGEVILDIAGLSPEDITVEMMITKRDSKGALHICEVHPYRFIEMKDGLVHYKVSVVPERTGMFEIGTRFYPSNPMLPHKQDLPLVKWL